MKYGHYEVIEYLGGPDVLVVCNKCGNQYERRLDNLKIAGDKACCRRCTQCGPKPTIHIKYLGKRYSLLAFRDRFMPMWSVPAVRYHYKKGKTPEQIINAYNVAPRLRNRVNG